MIAPRTRAALKEWAIVCRALADGRQTLLIRKGGIEEIRTGFQVTHKDFWLFPTYVHQNAEDLIPALHTEFTEVQETQPPLGTIPVQLYATAEDVVKVMDLERLRSLQDCHILSWECVASRFRYRNKPGVHVITIRVHRRPAVISVPNTPAYDGCVSWVDLDEALSTEGCTSVLSDEEFGARLVDIRRRLGAGGSQAAVLNRKR